jgi:phage regulator Rha-like protein
MTRKRTTALAPIEHISQSIMSLRGQRVLLDRELALLYSVTTKRFNEQVKRNLARFPADFMFRLNAPVGGFLWSKWATLKPGRGQHRKYLPCAFTEHGVIMAATILNSPRAIEMSVYLVRAFVQLRGVLASNRQLAEKFAELERRVSSHDQAIVGIMKTLRELMRPPLPPKRPIGFVYPEEK